jgi:transcriptional regulator with XRE-family HTH domain
MKRLRALANLTQAEVAERLGVRRSTVSMWEIGESLPRTEARAQLNAVSKYN